jgi:hypothetical protein
VAPCSWGGVIGLVADDVHAAYRHDFNCDWDPEADDCDEYDAASFGGYDYGSEPQYAGTLEACPEGSDGCNSSECRSGGGAVTVTALEPPTVSAECGAELIYVGGGRCSGVYRLYHRYD